MLVLVIFPVTFHQSRLYTTNRSRTHIGEVFELFKATITATLILVALTYFTRERYSRLTLAVLPRLRLRARLADAAGLPRCALDELRRRGFNLKSILVIGAGELGQRVVETIEHHRELGFRVVGVLTRDPEKAGHAGAGRAGHGDRRRRGAGARTSSRWTRSSSRCRSRTSRW